MPGYFHAVPSALNVISAMLLTS